MDNGENISNAGLVDTVILLKKTDTELIEQISKKRSLLLNRVKKMMAHRVWTIKQYADLIGASPQYVHQLLRPIVKEKIIDVKLNHCFPLPDGNSDGPKCVVRDEKSEKILLDSLK